VFGEQVRKQLVFTALGRDHPGVLEELTRLIVRYDGNVEASRLQRLGGDFALLMFVTAPEDRIEALSQSLNELHFVKFDVLTRLSEASEVSDEGEVTCAITVIGADHLGIIHEVTRYLAEQGINVDTMSTQVTAAPMSGTPLFSMSAVVRVPARLEVDDLREALAFIGDELSVDTQVFEQEAHLLPPD
jgi:glycine cleavage system transcriptional repressor